jgi:hypothetical protein
MFNKDLNPILHTIEESIEKLMVGHTKKIKITKSGFI